MATPRSVPHPWIHAEQAGQHSAKRNGKGPKELARHRVALKILFSALGGESDVQQEPECLTYWPQSTGCRQRPTKAMAFSSREAPGTGRTEKWEVGLAGLTFHLAHTPRTVWGLET